jgi:hypothetical protein
VFTIGVLCGFVIVSVYVQVTVVLPGTTAPTRRAQSPRLDVVLSESLKILVLPPLPPLIVSRYSTRSG